jgi:FkbM family methyltransferase
MDGMNNRSARTWRPEPDREADLRAHNAQLRKKLETTQRRHADDVASLRARIAHLELTVTAARARADAMHVAAARWRGQRRLRGDEICAPLFPALSAALRAIAPPAVVSDDPVYAGVRDAWLAGERPAGATTRTIGGLQWTIPDGLADRGSLAHRLRQDGWLPFGDIATLRQFVVGGIMLDIGANIGTTAIPRLALGDCTRVYAAEPQAENYRCLVGNSLDNCLAGLLTPCRLAIGSQNGTASLRRSQHMAGHMVIPDTRPELGDDVEQVPMCTLETWITQLAIDIRAVHFIKVDAEGWDGHVLLGAGALVDVPHLVWQLELNPGKMQKSGVDLAALFQYIGERFTFVYGLHAESGGALRPAREIGALIEAAGRLGHRDTDVVLGHGAIV